MKVICFAALAWHPFHEEYFVSGSFDGSIFHWLVGYVHALVSIYCIVYNHCSLWLGIVLFWL